MNGKKTHTHTHYFKKYRSIYHTASIGASFATTINTGDVNIEQHFPDWGMLRRSRCIQIFFKHFSALGILVLKALLYCTVLYWCSDEQNQS